MRPVRVLPACLAAALALPTASADEPADTWRDLLVRDEPQTSEERPHPTDVHEWWYFTVHSPDSECGSTQAMVTFLADAEAGHDHLLSTAVVDGVPHDLSREFPPGSLQRTVPDAGPGVGLSLGESHAEGRFGRWDVEVRSGDAELLLQLEAVPQAYWRRRAPEGWGVLELTLAARAAATGSLRIGQTTCALAGTGYFEHVWGTWSRVPMWGVDFLNAHLENGWSVYARRAPMRGADNLFPFLGVDEEAYWPPVMVVTDGVRHFVASSVDFAVTAETPPHPDLGVPVPDGYAVTGTGFSAPEGGTAPGAVTLTVGAAALATILLPATSSGVLEGWAPASLDVDGAVAHGTAEVEIQRFGTRYPR